MSEEIHVPALVENEQVVIPEFWLGKEIEHKFNEDRSDIPLTLWQGYVSTRRSPYSSLQYNTGRRYLRDSGRLCDYIYLDKHEKIQAPPPTLEELVHAYFSVDLPPYGKSPDARVNSTHDGEWTSTFLQDGKRIIENPEDMILDEKNDRWIIEGGKVAEIETPPNGYVTRFDKSTGFPIETSQDIEVAKSSLQYPIFFSFSPAPYANIIALNIKKGDTVFFISANETLCQEDFRGRIGARSCRRIGV